MKEFFKLIYEYFVIRFTLKPFDVWTEKVCKSGKNNGYYVGKDNVIYYGGFIFGFKSAFNDSIKADYNSDKLTD